MEKKSKKERPVITTTSPSLKIMEVSYLIREETRRRSKFTISNQCFRPNLVGLGGRNYTNADGKYIPIHLRASL